MVELKQENVKYGGNINREGSLYWNEPTEGHATRRPPIRQAKTARGYTIANDTVVFHESELEHRVSTIIQARNDVRELHSQFPVLPFTDVDGVVHKHTFDFYVIFNDDHRVAVAVKYVKKQKQIHDMFRRIEMTTFSHVADDLRLMTELDASYDAFHNAQAILNSREFFDADEYKATRSIASRLAGQFRFGELLRNCSNFGVRRNAIWQLIDHGLLVPLEVERISEMSWLKATH